MDNRQNTTESTCLCTHQSLYTTRIRSSLKTIYLSVFKSTSYAYLNQENWKKNPDFFWEYSKKRLNDLELQETGFLVQIGVYFQRKSPLLRYI